MKFYKQLDRVEQRYRILKLEVEALRKTVKTLHQQPPPLIITNAEAIILNLPAHLQKTYITLQQLGRCEAQQAADKTGKARALESSYLNQLVQLGYARRHRVKRTVIFTPTQTLTKYKRINYEEMQEAPL